MVSALLTTLEFLDENRDVNAMYKIIINYFQGIVHNWYKNISPNIKNIIKVDVKNNFKMYIEEGVWTLEKYLIAQFEYKNL